MKFMKHCKKCPDYITDRSSVQTFDETRRLAVRQAMSHKDIEILSLSSIIQNLKRPAAATRIMMQFSPASTIKYSVVFRLFTAAITNMGTERHYHYLDDIEDGKGTKNFILNSSDFEAAKCWAGGLGQSATHAIVYAQLILKGISYGLHAFVVPIRDPKNLLPYTGLIVGDMGEKIGLNGIDNGFVVFNKYPIPRENLLNKFGEVTEDGEYVSPIKDPNKRHGAALGSLSAGRVNITCICEAMGIKALTIAIRYAAQHRLLPYLAAAYVLREFNTYFIEVFYQFSIDTNIGSKKDVLPDLGMEIHAISSACKSVAGWIMKDAIQECREASSGIGDVRNDHDANLTYEGENHVLIQQTSNWLLKMWPLILNEEKISTPLKSADFLSDGLEILRKGKFTAFTFEEICAPENIISIYQWLTCYLLKRSYYKVETELKSGKSNFWAKNNSHVYHCKNLSIVFIQHFFLQRMLSKISEAEDPAIKNVLTNLFVLYGLWSLEKHIPTLYHGEFAQGPTLPNLLQHSILKLCADLKNDAVSLIDAVAPPDFILNSILGASDGMVYKHLESAIYSSPYAMERPKWWKEIINWKDNKSKL
ncbi:hypothetical protein NQ314_005996 [Rhamnusium bicolor]|uniref:Acyl-coenzyme A oxidase n=1 Tax=Rhamnusium bicolor TaxID=1586634 RepID=A0AAV8Z9Z4_9CUCU|nr:hypothetical protein NQ314_005996 [Rhamnusium bicolor]